MKILKLILAMIVLITAGSPQTAKAQQGSAYPIPLIAGDSLATADTVFKKITITAGYEHMGIQVAIKKGAGTLDGKLYLYTSVGSGSVFNYILTDSATITAVPVNALTANGGYTHTAWINKTSPPGTSYIMFVTQTGSLTASPTRWTYTARK